MIFMTVGTILPFDRLARALDAWAMEQGQPDIFAQLGDIEDGNYQPRSFEWVKRVTPTVFREKVAAADLVVTHAGIGTIVTALTLATPVLVMPRKAALREHVNDHQLETVRHFADRPGVSIAMEAEEFGPKLDALLGGDTAIPTLGPHAQDSLIAAIRTAIHG